MRSGMSRYLLSFPGQGAKVAVERLEHWLGHYGSFRNQIDRQTQEFLAQKVDRPETIAMCSNLLYREVSTEKQGFKNETGYVIGHSLGELNALSASVNNEIWSLKDIAEIAAYRNELMVEATSAYLQQNGVKGEQFELWAVMDPKSKGLRDDLKSSFGGEGGVQLANDNAMKQIVVTGLSSRLQMWSNVITEERGKKIKFTRLSNPFSIPFHNNDVLRPVQEPLYDFMWNKIKDNGKGRFMEEEVLRPIVSNYSGKITKRFDEALENFVVGSTNIVKFVDCCGTLHDLGIEHAYHLGPGSSIGKLIERNCRGRIEHNSYFD